MPLFRRSSIPWDRRFPQPAFPPTNVLFFPPSALAVLPSTLSLRFFGARRVYITRLPRQRGFDSIRFITRWLQLESGQCKSPVVSLGPIIGTRGSVSRKKFVSLNLARPRFLNLGSVESETPDIRPESTSPRTHVTENVLPLVRPIADWQRGLLAGNTYQYA